MRQELDPGGHQFGPPWTPERIAKLKELVAAGYSSLQIARVIGGTRNAVIGKAHRLGLVKPGRPSTPGTASLQQKLNANRGRHRGVRPPRPAPADVVLAIKPEPIAHSANIWEPLGGSKPVTLMELGAYACKWPVELSGALEPHFCGARTDTSYCARHTAEERARSTKQHPSAKRSERGLQRLIQRLEAA